VRSAYSNHHVATSTAGASRNAVTLADVTSELGSVDAPEMPAHLAAKVTAAIAAESARRQFTTFQ
jgi:hypothetical protein